MKLMLISIMVGGILLLAACTQVGRKEVSLPVFSGYEKFYGDSPVFSDPRRDPCAEKRLLQSMTTPMASSSEYANTLELILKNEKTALAALLIADIFCLEAPSGSERNGWTIAHAAAAEFEEAALEALKDPALYRQVTSSDSGDDAGLTVAHVAAVAFVKAALYTLDHPEIYRLAQPESAASKAGRTVAHAAVQSFERAALHALNFPVIFRLRQHVSSQERSGWTVAHTAVWHHERAALEALKDPNAYYLALPAQAPLYGGYSVAHFAVMRWPSAARYALNHPTIPGISDGSGFLVGTLARQTLAAEEKALNPPQQPEADIEIPPPETNKPEETPASQPQPASEQTH